MRTLVTKSILLLGRYAVLPVAGLAVVLFIGWFVAFDAYPGMAVIALPVVLPLTTVAIALPIGLLLPMPHARDHNAVDEAGAPGLLAMWNELDDTTPRSCRTLRIDPGLNASIGERRRYFGLAHRHLTMTVGLSLLLVLDERAARTVVAHEVAHARLQHTTGGANLYEFMVAAANLFDHLDPSAPSPGGSGACCWSRCSPGCRPNSTRSATATSSRPTARPASGRERTTRRAPSCSSTTRRRA